MSLVYCPEFIQSPEKCGSQSIRDACIKCGRTQEAHVKPYVVQKQEVSTWEEAEEFLFKTGINRANPAFELLRGTVASYIEWKRKYGT